MDEALIAFDREWKTGDRAVAKTMAKQYVQLNASTLIPRFGAFDIPALVNLVGHYRSQGDEANRILVDMWLLSEFEPQHIGGTIRVGG